MAKEVSLDTPMDENFKITEEVAHLIVDNIKLNSLSLTQPQACCRYWFVGRHLSIVSVFLASTSRIHFALCNENGWQWQLHFESIQRISLNTGWKRARQDMEDSLQGYDIHKAFLSLFPVDQESERYEWRNGFRGDNTVLHFKAPQPFNTIADAIEVFDEFYSFVVDVLKTADLNQIQEKYPDASECFRLFKLMSN